MHFYTLDTSAIISRRLSDIPEGFLLSAIVLMELMAGASDESERRRYETLSRDYRKDNSLIVPSFEDWVFSKQSSLLACSG